VESAKTSSPAKLVLIHRCYYSLEYSRSTYSRSLRRLLAELGVLGFTR